MPPAIRSLANDFLRSPKEISVAPAARPVDKIDQRVILMESGAKRNALVSVLSQPEVSRAIVFTRTKRGADRVEAHLEEAGISSGAIHGNKSQSQRERALASFRDGRIKILVATDIAARGIDVDGVSHVINFELPNIPESYVHRIGRTARAGASGVAISFCDITERPYLRDIEKLIGKALETSGDFGHQGRHHQGERPSGSHAKQRPAAARSGNGKPSAGKPAAHGKPKQAGSTSGNALGKDGSAPVKRRQGPGGGKPSAGGNGGPSKQFSGPRRPNSRAA
jgi:ATP-dependent RNA helicase RhlE